MDVPMTTKPNPAAEQAGVQSLETGLAILAAFIDLEPVPMLKTIAERAGMPPAKVHRYLVSFCRMGFVERDPDSGRYRLGQQALRLGLAAANGVDAVRVARPLMGQIRDTLGQTVVLAVWGSTGATVVLLEHMNGPVTVSVRVGSILPLLASSTGRTFGAWLGRAVTRNVLATEVEAAARRQSPGIPSSMEQVETLFRDVRKRGLARVTGNLNPGVNALSAPVFDHTGQIAAVLSALGPARTFSNDWNGPIAAGLRQSAAALSRALGYTAEFAPHLGRDD
jgi:DNA-binding IclR family transcriptional regulator